MDLPFRKAVKIEKEKKVWNLLRFFMGGWMVFEVIFTLFILCLEWPNYNGLIRPEKQKKIFITMWNLTLLWVRGGGKFYTFCLFLFWRLPLHGAGDVLQELGWLSQSGNYNVHFMMNRILNQILDMKYQDWNLINNP